MVHTTLFPEGKNHCLTLSYDDGRMYDRRMIEIMDKNGVRGTFHLNSGYLNKETFVTSEEIKELYKNHEVSCHALTHPPLQSVPRETLVYQIMEDRRRLEEACGYVVRGMSYPYGTYNQAVVDALPFLGMEYARTVVSTEKFTLPTDFLRWDATCHHNNPKLMELADKFISPFTYWRRGTHLFYLWGHSYEFDRDNNWEVLEAFCEKLGNRDDIWYATNIEIVDYMNAVKQIRFSADAHLAYNPTCTDVWVSVNDVPTKLAAGQVTAI